MVKIFLNSKANLWNKYFKTVVGNIAAPQPPTFKHIYFFEVPSNADFDMSHGQSTWKNPLLLFLGACRAGLFLNILYIIFPAFRIGKID